MVGGCVTAPTRSVSERVLFLVVKFYAPQVRTAVRGISVPLAVIIKWKSARRCGGQPHTHGYGGKMCLLSSPFWPCEKISVKSKTVIKNDIWERLE